MTVSVIIPVLNEESVLNDSLARLSRQTTPYELIVVDGGSDDATPEIAERWGKLVLSPRGRAVQMNRGAELASGDVLLFMHADVWLDDGALSAVLSAVTAGVVAGSFVQRIDGRHPLYRWIEAAGDFRARRLGLFYGDAGIFVTREAFEQIGGFPNIEICEEFEFSRRLRQVGRTALLKPKATLSARRWERDGILKTTLKNWLITVLYFVGVSPKRLASLYKQVR
ncbi:MAG: TIGR04283 family arsenosugar biosynthesis glycosyltransferase [Candidatus Poribacteria bacterium]|nr:TIGR04283 family arsenosugar biosynthesis glycosyltransferase [Candidatus Poribacteria bacterium]